MDTKRKGTRGGGKGDAANGPARVTSIRLDADTHDRFKRYARSQHRSVSQQLRQMMDDALEAHEREPAA